MADGPLCTCPGTCEVHNAERLLGAPLHPKRRGRPPKPRGTRITTRDLGTRGVAETSHTSFRLDPEDRDKLRELARVKYGGITMSAVVRILVRQEHEKEFGS